jgi:hypothetical protein
MAGDAGATIIKGGEKGLDSEFRASDIYGFEVAMQWALWIREEIVRLDEIAVSAQDNMDEDVARFLLDE